MEADGVLNVLKPPGMTSHDVVHQVRKAFGIKRAGHTGTLDPGASGVLSVCLGRATRIARFITEDRKEYRAWALLGVATSTGDAFGQVRQIADASHLCLGDVQEARGRFMGPQWQVPPMTSAVKIGGERLYKLAQKGLEVERQARKVNIYRLDVVDALGFNTPHPRVLLDITCSKGTYIRTLIEDLAASMGTLACMSFLLRTAVGPFALRESHSLEEIRAAAARGDGAKLLIPMDEALVSLPRLVVNPSAVRSVSAGATIYPAGVAYAPDDLPSGGPVRVHGPQGLLAVAVTEEEKGDTVRRIFRPLVVLV